MDYFLSLPESGNLALHESIASVMKHSLRTQRHHYNERPRSEKKVRAISFLGRHDIARDWRRRGSRRQQRRRRRFCRGAAIKWRTRCFDCAYRASSSAKFFATPKTTKQFSLPTSRKSNLANSSLMPAKVTGRGRNRLSIRWTSYVCMPAESMSYEHQSQTSTNR